MSKMKDKAIDEINTTLNIVVSKGFISNSLSKLSRTEKRLVISKMKELEIARLNQVKQRPILFSTPMVQGILEGRKTMTRRLNGLDLVNKEPDEWKFVGNGTNPEKENDKRLYAYFNIKNTDTWTYCLFPYGKIGDILWVRESYTILEPEHCEGMSERFYYKASHHETNEEWRKESIEQGYPYKWKPSIHMPKTACRIYLEITNIRVERLQSIGKQDALNEGIKEGVELEDTKHELTYYQYVFGGNRYKSAVKAFKMLWIKINGFESWELNPYVWVIEFKRIGTPSSCSVKIEED